MEKQPLYKILENKLLKNPDKVVFQIRRGFAYSCWTGQQVVADSLKLGAYLQSRGVRSGDKILIWAPNMPEWSILFLTCLHLDLVAVPVDVRSKWETVENYIRQTDPKMLFASRFTKTFIEDCNIAQVSLEDIFATELPTISEMPALPDYVRKTAPVAILFTSGSTGNPKGVIITEDNILSQLAQTDLILPPIKRYETVSILPLSHAYELLYGLIVPLFKEGRVTYLERVNPLTIKKALRRNKATYLMVVPQFLRILFEGITIEVKNNGSIGTFNALIAVSRYFPMATRKVIFRRVHTAFGGNLEFIGCGSAPLEPKLAKNWEAMGFTVIEGYGATETTALASALNWKKRKFGTVGRPPVNTKIKISEGHEILISGETVTPGYYKNDEKNSESFTDGWYRTGDTGHYDLDGNLIITGRISTRIVMTDGTKVYPEDIERKLNNNQEIKDSCVVGKITGEDVSVHAFILASEIKDILELGKLIEKTNLSLEFKQQITSYALWHEKDFPRLRTLKVDRDSVKKYLADKGNCEKNETKGNTGASAVNFHTIEGLLRMVAKTQTISRKDRLESNLGLDSLRRIQLAALLEDNLGVEVNELNLTPTVTVNDLINMVNSSKKNQAVYSVDSILEHWRFNSFTKNFRMLIQKYLIFPFHARKIDIKITFGKEALENFPKQSIIIFNHIGMFELITVMRLLPKEILRSSILPATHQIWSEGGLILRSLIDLCISAYPFVQRGEGLSTSFEATGELAHKGYSILFAPEGRMQKEKEIQDFKEGLGLLAKELRLPVVMFRIGDEYRDVWPAPPPEIDGIHALRYIFPKKASVVGVKIKLAVVNHSLSYEDLTKDIQRQFLEL